jgi:hypothetical protein
MYRFEGMSLRMVAIGVEVPDPCDATESSDSVRLSELVIVLWTACERGWNMGAGVGVGTDAEFHDPSRYKLIARYGSAS